MRGTAPLGFRLVRRRVPSLKGIRRRRGPRTSGNTNRPGAPDRIGHVLVASGFGDDSGGGLFRLDDGRFHQIDALSTTGLALGDGRLARFLRAPGDQTSTGEVLVYDRLGLLSYHRLDAVPDPHDAVYVEDLLVVASSASNSVLWIDRAGEIVRRWSPDPGAGDAWHINGVACVDGSLYVTSFGRFAAHREWAGPKQEGAGLLMRLEDGFSVAEGLTCPHSPRRAEEGWYVCESEHRRLCLYDADGGSPVRTIELDGWTRGIAVADDRVFVGESAGRSPGSGRAAVAVLERSTLRVLDRIPLPCSEVFDLVFVPDGLLHGVSIGSDTNSHRVIEQLLTTPQSGSLRFSGAPLPLPQIGLELYGELPRSARPGEGLVRSIRVRNTSGLHYASIPPHPVLVVSQWFSPSGDLLAEARHPLASELRPGAEVDVDVHFAAPAAPGTYRLRITVVQEHVAWFHDHGVLPIQAEVQVTERARM